MKNAMNEQGSSEKAYIVFIAPVLLFVAEVLIQLRPGYIEGRSIFNVVFILIPLSSVAVSTACTKLLVIKMANSALNVSAVLFGLLSAVPFQVMTAQVADKMGGESSLIGMAVFWMIGGGYTGVMSIIFNLKIVANVKQQRGGSSTQ